MRCYYNCFNYPTHQNFFNYTTHRTASDETRIYRLWQHTAHQLHTLLCECVVIPETSFIRSGRMHELHGIIPRFSWYYTTKFRGIIPCFFFSMYSNGFMILPEKWRKVIDQNDKYIIEWCLKFIWINSLWKTWKKLKLLFPQPI